MFLPFKGSKVVIVDEDTGEQVDWEKEKAAANASSSSSFSLTGKKNTRKTQFKSASPSVKRSRPSREMLLSDLLQRIVNDHKATMDGKNITVKMTSLAPLLHSDYVCNLTVTSEDGVNTTYRASPHESGFKTCCGKYIALTL
jgi:hypothetical protein